MKKLLCLLLAVCLCVSFAACAQAPASDSTVSAGTSGSPADNTGETAENTAPADSTAPADAPAAAPAGQPQLPDGLTQLPMQPGVAYACEVWMGETSETFSLSVQDYTVEPSARDGYEVRTATLLLGSFNGADPYTEYVFFDLGENLNPMFESGAVYRDGEELDFTVLRNEAGSFASGPDYMVTQQILSVEVPAGYDHIALVPMNFKPFADTDGMFADLVNSSSLWFLMGTPSAKSITCNGEELNFAAESADGWQLYSHVGELWNEEMDNEPVVPPVEEPEVPEADGRWLTLNMERSMLEKTRGDAWGALVGVQLVDNSDPSAAVFRIVIEHTGLPADAGVRVFVWDSWDEYPCFEDEVAPGNGTTEITCVVNLNNIVFPLAFNAHIHSPNLQEDIPLCGLVDSLG